MYLAASRSARTSSTPLLEAASISCASMSFPAAISVHGPQTPHGSAVGPFRQLSARARMRALVVLPHPRGPVKRNACATRPMRSAFDNVRTTCSCPVRSAKRCGRYLRARTRYGVFIGRMPWGAGPETGHTVEAATVAPFRAWRVHDPPSPGPRSSVPEGADAYHERVFASWCQRLASGEQVRNWNRLLDLGVITRRNVCPQEGHPREAHGGAEADRGRAGRNLEAARGPGPPDERSQGADEALRPALGHGRAGAAASLRQSRRAGDRGGERRPGKAQPGPDRHPGLRHAAGEDRGRRALATAAFPSAVNWRRARDSNPRYPCGYS